ADFLDSLDRERRAAMWRGCVERGGLLFVAQDDEGSLAGFACVAPGVEPDLGNAAELTAIYLEPSRYGSGVGTLLWNGIERQISEPTAYLWVLADNERGKAFYRKNGFRPDGKSKRFEIAAQSFEELRYLKRLR